MCQINFIPCWVDTCNFCLCGSSCNRKIEFAAVPFSCAVTICIVTALPAVSTVLRTCCSGDFDSFSCNCCRKCIACYSYIDFFLVGCSIFIFPVCFTTEGLLLVQWNPFSLHGILVLFLTFTKKILRPVEETPSNTRFSPT